VVVQRRPANTTAKRNANHRSVNAALVIEPLKLDQLDLSPALLPEGQLVLSVWLPLPHLALGLDLHQYFDVDHAVTSERKDTATIAPGGACGVDFGC
jgi:hypothetical protein